MGENVVESLDGRRRDHLGVKGNISINIIIDILVSDLWGENQPYCHF